MKGTNPLGGTVDAAGTSHPQVYVWNQKKSRSQNFAAISSWFTQPGIGKQIKEYNRQQERARSASETIRISHVHPSVNGTVLSCMIPPERTDADYGALSGKLYNVLLDQWFRQFPASGWELNEVMRNHLRLNKDKPVHEREPPPFSISITDTSAAHDLEGSMDVPDVDDAAFIEQCRQLDTKGLGPHTGLGTAKVTNVSTSQPLIVNMVHHAGPPAVEAEPSVADAPTESDNDGEPTENENDDDDVSVHDSGVSLHDSDPVSLHDSDPSKKYDLDDGSEYKGSDGPNFRTTLLDGGPATMQGDIGSRTSDQIRIRRQHLPDGSQELGFGIAYLDNHADIIVEYSGFATVDDDNFITSMLFDALTPELFEVGNPVPTTWVRLYRHKVFPITSDGAFVTLPLTDGNYAVASLHNCLVIAQASRPMLADVLN